MLFCSIYYYFDHKNPVIWTDISPLIPTIWLQIYNILCYMLVSITSDDLFKKHWKIWSFSTFIKQITLAIFVTCNIHYIGNIITNTLLLLLTFTITLIYFLLGLWWMHNMIKHIAVKYNVLLLLLLLSFLHYNCIKMFVPSYLKIIIYRCKKIFLYFIIYFFWQLVRFRI